LSTIDFSKAFDSVWHYALFYKLLTLGRLALSAGPDLFSQTEEQNSSSMVLEIRIRHGVSQGSVLGPALFILYVDNLAKTLTQRTKHSSYADNLAIWSSSPDPLKAADTVQKAFNHHKEWSLKWHLLVNLAKCECCFFSTDPHQASHQPHLTLTIHINFTSTPSSYQPFKESLFQMYKAFVRPFFSYASPGWYPFL